MNKKIQSSWGTVMRLLKGELGLLIILAALCIVFGIISPYFWVERNLLNVTRQVSIVLTVAMGMLCVVLSGEIDLSVGSTAALSGIAAAWVMRANGSIFLGVLAALAIGLLAGLGYIKSGWFNYLLVGNHEINIKGAPIGTLCCFGVVALMDLFIIKRVIPSPPSYIKVFFKPLIASVLMGGAAWACYGLLTGVLKMGNSLATLGSIAVAAVIYLILVVALRVISREDLALMPKGEKIANLLRLK